MTDLPEIEGRPLAELSDADLEGLLRRWPGDIGQRILDRFAAYERRIEELERQVGRDSLTGLLNREGFERRLEEIYARSVRSSGYDGSILVGMIDLDGFKSVNDRAGHSEGDRVLKETARFLKSTFSVTDVIARWGGDEFTLILPRVQRGENEARFVQRLQNELVSPFNEWVWREYQRGSVRTAGMSLGLARIADVGLSPEGAVKRADKAMYYAKRGSLGVHVWSGEIEYLSPSK